MTRAIALLLAAFALRPALPVEPADVSVERHGRLLRVQTGAAVANVRLDRYRLQVRERATAALLTAEQRGGLFFERAGTPHGLGAVTGVANPRCA